jgi:hypothetical protein
MAQSLLQHVLMILSWCTHQKQELVYVWRQQICGGQCSSMQVHSKLHKRLTILSYHRIRETIAAGMVGFYFIPGEYYPADILSKHWGY